MAGLLASCGAVSSPSAAFSIDGASYSRDDVNGLLQALVVLQELNVTNGVAPTGEVAEIVSVMVQYRAGAAVLEKWGTPVSDADRKQLESQLMASLPPTVDDKVKRLLIDINATGRAVSTVKAPPAAEVEAMYGASPASTGHMCIRLVTLKSRDDARSMIDAVNDGGDFASLATKSGAAAGGVVTGGNDNDCVAISSLNARIGTTAVRALLDAPVGRPTEAFEDEEGWHVAVHRPYDEVKADLGTALASESGQHLTYGLLATADVRVNSVYGTWNRVTARVE
jgi:hypothetical protein